MNLQRAESYLDQRLAGLFRVSDLGALVRNGQESASLVADVSGHIATLQMRIANEPPSKSPGAPEKTPWDIQIQRTKEAAGTLIAVLLPNVVPDKAAVNAYLPL